jgi:hypothetical protein
LPEIKFAAFDVETQGLHGDFISGAIVTEHGGTYWEALASFTETMRHWAERGYTLIAHNAEYDIMTSLWVAGEPVTMHFYDQTFNRGTWHLQGKRKTAEIWDSMNLCAGVSLKDLGESIGLPKYPTPQRLLNKSPDRFQWQCERHGAWECVECYNMRDAEIVYRFATHFADWLQSQQLRMKRTLGGNAVAIWQAYDPGQQQNLQAPLVRDLARASYHGGRVELFKPGVHESVYTADITSFYPSIMQNVPMPDLRGLTYVEAPKKLDLSGLHGAIECTVMVPQMYVPPLPVKFPDGKLYYPVGTFRGSWIIEEVRAAVARGAKILEIHRIAYTRKVVYPFASFVSGLYSVRKDFEHTGDARAFQIKTMMNALPGRLGLREEQRYRAYTVSNGKLSNVDIEGKDVQFFGNTRVIVDDKQVRMLSSINNVLWAATINAYGRVRLLLELEKAGASLIYCDTDSVFATTPLEVSHAAPGVLRETGHYRHGQFFANKLYRLESGDTEDSAIARGIPKQLAMEFLRTGRVHFESPVGVIVGVRSHTNPRHWQTLTRTRRTEATGRVVLRPDLLAHGLGTSETVPPSLWEAPGDPEADRTDASAAR